MRIGILGGGQLGWMAILEGRKLGYEFYVLDRSPHSPASRIADRWFPPDEVEEFCASVDVITYEFEHIEDEVLEALSGRVVPSLEILKKKRSRIEEKTFLYKLGYPVPEFKMASLKDLKKRVEEMGLPLMVKRDRQGYDGKGQHRLKTLRDVEELLHLYDPEERFIVERFIDFRMEVSSVGVRNRRGEVRVYPLTKNFHEEGILLFNYMMRDSSLQKRVHEMVASLMEDMEVVGLLAVEFFLTESGDLLINEFAPRPHNTGHYTLDCAQTSQFENLIRAISDLPLGSTEPKSWGGMVNILGLSYDEIHLKEILSLEGTKLYWYGKEKRPRRKMGHINVTGKDQEEVTRKIDTILEILYKRTVALPAS